MLLDYLVMVQLNKKSHPQHSNYMEKKATLLFNSLTLIVRFWHRDKYLLHRMDSSYQLLEVTKVLWLCYIIGMLKDRLFYYLKILLIFRALEGNFLKKIYLD